MVVKSKLIINFLIINHLNNFMYLFNILTASVLAFFNSCFAMLLSDCCLKAILITYNYHTDEIS